MRVKASAASSAIRRRGAIMRSLILIRAIYGGKRIPPVRVNLCSSVHE